MLHTLYIGKMRGENEKIMKKSRECSLLYCREQALRVEKTFGMKCLPSHYSRFAPTKRCFQ